MAELVPQSFASLARRMFRELDGRGSIFDLPRSKFFLGDPDRDLSVRFHGRVAGSPLGPAAGPQTQLAQNIVLSWLGGCRIMELKTVQIDDELDIPRPCIDMQTIGFNVEWSQELKLEQSLEEYVKGSMLIEMLVASGRLELTEGFERTIFDMSVGYDLAGIQTDRVQAFMRGMMDASPVVERLRAQIPDELAHLRELEFTTRLSDTLTLSTFHGCPPEEIESIIDYLLRELGLHCIVKLNPTLLGKVDGRRLLNETLGYDELEIPDAAFDDDTSWDQMVGFVGRLGDTADALGLGFGVKFNNTQIVRNHREFFPAEESVMYLSGAPLHVMAVELVARFRRAFKDRFPISFSAGIDRKNFADATAIGLVPVTVCSDLLKPGGYGRCVTYYKNLSERMRRCGARDLDELIIRGWGEGLAALDACGPDAAQRAACAEALDGAGDLRAAAGGELFARWVSRARLLATEHYSAHVLGDARYRRAATAKPPRKLDSTLVLLDCITCDKCVPVCPNNANFTFTLPRGEVPVQRLTPLAGGGFAAVEGAPLRVEQKHQIGNYIDSCNDCGNCDIFCPELGGPYKLKPRFHGSLDRWAEEADRDGFFVGPDGTWARFEGREYHMAKLEDGRVRYSGEGFEVQFDPADPARTVRGEADAEVDLAWFRIMEMVRDGVLAEGAIGYVASVVRG